MKTSKSMKWAAILMMVPVVLNSPSILQLFKPDLCVGIYIESLAGMTKAEAIALNSGLYQTILLGFQALGLSIFAYLLLSIPVILIPYKRGQKWAWKSLLIFWIFLWGGNMFLGYISNDMFDFYYSIPPLVCVATSLGLAYKETFKKKDI